MLCAVITFGTLRSIASDRGLNRGYMWNKIILK